MWNEVDHAIDGRIVQVQSRWGHVVSNGENTENGLHRPSCAKEVPDGGFRRRHRELLRRAAEQAFDGGELDLIAHGRRGSMRVDVVDVARLDASPDRKSTRLNSSHVKISYAVFCLKKK